MRLRRLSRASWDVLAVCTYLHHIAGEIWEFIQGDLRLLYFYERGRVVVCSHGFLKQSRKTPQSEIARAEQWQERYRTARAAGRLVVEEEPQ